MAAHHPAGNMGEMAAQQSGRLREIAERNADEFARVDYVQARLLAEACGADEFRPVGTPALCPGVDIDAIHRRTPGAGA